MRFTATHAKPPTPQLDYDTDNPFDHAACRDHDPEIFFPNDPRSDTGTQEPLAICNACPIVDLCLQATMRAEEGRQRHGISGGTTPQQRARLARGMNDGKRACRRCRCRKPADAFKTGRNTCNTCLREQTRLRNEEERRNPDTAQRNRERVAKHRAAKRAAA